MASWFTVAVDGEARVVAQKDPGKFWGACLAHLSEGPSEVEFEIDPGSSGPYESQDGSTFWLIPLTIKFSGTFDSSEDAKRAAVRAAVFIEAAPLSAEFGTTSAQLSLYLATVDAEDWDDPDVATSTLVDALRRGLFTIVAPGA